MGRDIAGIHQQKTAGAIGVFAVPWVKASLAKQSGLLIPGYAGHRNLPPAGLRHAKKAAAAADLRQNLPGDIQRPQQILVPIQSVNIKQHCARRVGIIRLVDGAAGELPQQPGIHCAKKQPALVRQPPRFGDMVQNPANFGSGKIAVDQQAGFLADHRLQPLGLQRFAVLRCAAALPNNGVIKRLARLLVP